MLRVVYQFGPSIAGGFDLDFRFAQVLDQKIVHKIASAGIRSTGESD